MPLLEGLSLTDPRQIENSDDHKVARQTQPKKASLLGLPAEQRNQILEAVLTVNTCYEETWDNPLPVDFSSVQPRYPPDKSSASQRRSSGLDAAQLPLNHHSRPETRASFRTLGPRPHIPWSVIHSLYRQRLNIQLHEMAAHVLSGSELVSNPGVRRVPLRSIPRLVERSVRHRRTPWTMWSVMGGCGEGVAFVHARCRMREPSSMVKSYNGRNDFTCQW